MLIRRTFLAATATAALTLPRPAFAATPALTVASRQIQVLGRAATVFGITNAAGGNGLMAREGARGRPLHRHRAAMTRATISSCIGTARSAPPPITTAPAPVAAHRPAAPKTPMISN